MKIVKKLLSLAVSVMCAANIMLCSMPVITAGAETYGVLTYEKADEDNDGKYDHVVIKSCDVSAASVNIPSKIAGLPVTVLGEYSFSDCAISSVTIPDSVTTIENYAFSGCGSLKSLTIPNSVKKIEYGAFAFSKKLTSVNIPYGITSLENMLFYDCESLENVTIPSSVTSIGDSVFEGCDHLESIAIPDSVTIIGESAFFACWILKSITIPGNVKSIGKMAFAACRSLESIIIMNPDCNIYNDIKTIYSNWGDIGYVFEGIIYGQAKSTAEEYADEYSCKFLAINEYGIVGDADGDKKVSAKDASLLFTEYKSIYNGGQSTFTEEQLGRCDSNGDGKITSIDASKAFSAYKRNYRIG